MAAPTGTHQTGATAFLDALALVNALTLMHAWTMGVTGAKRDNPLRGLTVLDEAGSAIEIDSLWRGSGGVLAFVRHFG